MGICDSVPSTEVKFYFFLIHEPLNHTMCNQLLVLNIKLMIYDDERATVKYLN